MRGSPHSPLLSCAFVPAFQFFYGRGGGEGLSRYLSGTIGRFALKPKDLTVLAEHFTVWNIVTEMTAGQTMRIYSGSNEFSERGMSRE